MYIKSFTILEALISLILMGIIISLTYSVFNLVERQMYMFKNENGTVLQYNLFNTTLKQDIYRAADFEVSEKGVLLKPYNGVNVSYEILKPYVLRTQEQQIDTFEIKTLSHSFFQAERLTLISEKLQLGIALLGDTIPAVYYLNRDNANLVNSHFLK